MNLGNPLKLKPKAKQKDELSHKLPMFSSVLITLFRHFLPFASSMVIEELKYSTQ